MVRLKLLTGIVALAASIAVTAAGTRAAAPGALLKSVTSSIEPRSALIIIEASEPVPYVASQPDPRTYLVELRDLDITGFADRFTMDPRQPVQSVHVERAQSQDGARLTRIRMTLVHPVRPRVRSSRNLIYVETDRVDRAPAPAPVGVLGARGVIRRAAPTPSSDAGRVRSATPPALPAEKRESPGVPSAAPPAPPADARQAFSPATAAATQAAQAAPAVVVPPMRLTATAQPRTFTGRPVSLDFQGADLRAVLRAFAEISSLNIVLDSTIQGTVEVTLRDVPWDQALDIILRANKLGYIADGAIVRIVPIAVLKAEEKERQELAEAQADAGTLVTMTRALSYAKAEDVVTLLKSSQVLSKRGNPTLDPRTNTLIVTDLQGRLDQISALIATLDQPQRQVEIEARIVQTNRDFARALGVQWGVGARASQALGNTLPFGFPNQASITGRTGSQGASDSPIDAVGSIVNLGVTAATTGIGLALGSVNGAVNLDVALSALERQGHGRLLSTPRVSTQNNVEAEITQGIQIPIQTVANNTVSVTFKDAALTLRVTPQITAANTVIMKITIENAQADFSRAVNGIPPINTQRALTQVLVNTGETTVIGGIYVSEEQARQDRTPGLHRIPILGWLFKRDDINDSSRELLIFITPRIVGM